MSRKGRSSLSEEDKKGRMFACTRCSYTSERKNNLKRHTLTMHGVNTGLRQCCGYRFSNKADAKLHAKLCHDKGYECPICGKVFARKALLERHFSVHTGYKEFSCSQCTYETSHKSNLERHMRVHQKPDLTLPRPVMEGRFLLYQPLFPGHPPPLYYSHRPLPEPWSVHQPELKFPHQAPVQMAPQVPHPPGRTGYTVEELLRDEPRHDTNRLEISHPLTPSVSIIQHSLSHLNIDSVRGKPRTGGECAPTCVSGEAPANSHAPDCVSGEAPANSHVPACVKGEAPGNSHAPGQVFRPTAIHALSPSHTINNMMTSCSSPSIYPTASLHFSPPTLMFASSPGQSEAQDTSFPLHRSAPHLEGLHHHAHNLLTPALTHSPGEGSYTSSWFDTSHRDHQDWSGSSGYGSLGEEESPTRCPAPSSQDNEEDKMDTDSEYVPKKLRVSVKFKHKLKGTE